MHGAINSAYIGLLTCVLTASLMNTRTFYHSICALVEFYFVLMHYLVLC